MSRRNSEPSVPPAVLNRRQSTEPTEGFESQRAHLLQPEYSEVSPRQPAFNAANASTQMSGLFDNPSVVNARAEQMAHVRFDDDAAHAGQREEFLHGVHEVTRAATAKRRANRDRLRRTRRERRVTAALHVYSIPIYSCFVPLEERQAQRRRLEQGLRFATTSSSSAASDAVSEASEAPRGNTHTARSGPAAQVLPPLYATESVMTSRTPGERAEAYVPAAAAEPPPQLSRGRQLEAIRYKLPECPPFPIPLYEQACHKYIFRDLFDPGFQFMELFFLVINTGMVVVNIGMAVVNVFFNSDEYQLSWVRTAAKVVFAVEFGVQMVMLAALLLIVLHATATNNIGTNLATDAATVMNSMATFSAFRVLGFASPAFAGRRVLPYFMNAVKKTDFLKGLTFTAGWLCLCGIAFVVVITKVSQIDFAQNKSITEWTFPNFVQLLGFLMNAARADDSYFKEISVLLDAVHRHYAGPGEPVEAKSKERPCLYTLVSKLLKIPQYQYYDFFNTVFNRHMDWHLQADVKEEAKKELERLEEARDRRGLEDFWRRQGLMEWATGQYSPASPPPLPLRKRLRKCATYLAFIFQIDTMSLRRYLQMTQSPLPFYRLGRESFLTSFYERDKTGMDMALWRGDPISRRTRDYAAGHPTQFNIAFACDDRSDVWDSDYLARNTETAEKEMQDVIDVVRDFTRNH